MSFRSFPASCFPASCVVAAMATLWLAGCANNSTPALTATLTFKADGAHFTGTVIRRESTSITMVDASGTAHTFLYSELSDIRYGTADAEKSDTSQSAAEASAGPASSSASSSSPPPTAPIVFPAGTEFPVTTVGYLDSCCVPLGAYSLGVVDADIKANGKVVIPQGANVSMTFTDKTVVDGRISMKFELGSADFGGHHYLISSAKGGTEPGAVVTYFGARDGSAEAKVHGLDVHLEDHDLMLFKAATPTKLSPSQ